MATNSTPIRIKKGWHGAVLLHPKPTAEVYYLSENVVLLQWENRTKYCSILGQPTGGLPGVNLVSVAGSAHTNPKAHADDSTAVVLPEFKGWHVFTAAPWAKYSVRVCLVKDSYEIPIPDGL